MQETEHYKLTKDAPEDFYDVNKVNANMDKVDTALHGLETGKEALLKNAAAKAAPVDADSFAIVDSADGGKTKRLTWVGLVAAIKTALSGFFAAASHSHAWGAITGKPDKFTPDAHKDSHKTGGADALAAGDIGAIPVSQKGAASGVAELDGGGKVPASQLPSYVDDVLEFANKSAFPASGESGKIYVALDTNLTWRWSGSAYVEISPSLALGETSGTAYRGDRGKAAYDHSQATGNAHGLTLAQLGAAAASHTHQVGDVTGALKQFGPVNVTIPVSGWTGTGPYTQTVSVSGVLAAWDWRLTLSLQKQTVTDTRKAQEKAMGCVTYCDTVNGGIALTCYEKKPEINILAVLSGEV